MSKSITYTALPNIPFVEPGDDIGKIIKDGLKEAGIVLQDDDVIIIAQKIISKAENRYVDLGQVVPSTKAEELAKVIKKDPRHIEIVLSESSELLRYRQNVMIVAHRLGFVMANAGIDESNISHAEGHRVLLLPVDPDKSCAGIEISS